MKRNGEKKELSNERRIALLQKEKWDVKDLMEYSGWGQSKAYKERDYFIHECNGGIDRDTSKIKPDCYFNQMGTTREKELSFAVSARVVNQSSQVAV